MQGQVCAHVIRNQSITRLGDWLKVLFLVSGIAETWTQVVWLKGSLQSQAPHYKFQGALVVELAQCEYQRDPDCKVNKTVRPEDQHQKWKNWKELRSRWRSRPGPSPQFTDSDSESLAGWRAELGSRTGGPCSMTTAGTQAMVLVEWRQWLALLPCYWRCSPCTSTPNTERPREATFSIPLWLLPYQLPLPVGRRAPRCSYISESHRSRLLSTQP